MRQVAVVTDSVSGLPREYQQALGIHVVPNLLVWSGEEYRDGVDIQPAEFYARLRQAKELPTTVAVPPAAFEDVFETLLAQDYDILGIFTGSKMSAIFENAYRAREQLGRGSIELVDSETLAMMLGWPVIQTARAAADGLDLAGCADLANRLLAKSDGFMTFETLEFLQRGGRISNAQWLFGTALKLKPIMRVVDGELVAYERIRTRRKALSRLLELVEKEVAGLRPLYLAVMHADAEETGRQLLDSLSTKLDPIETILTTVGPNLGTHGGPGAIAVCFMVGE